VWTILWGLTGVLWTILGKSGLAGSDPIRGWTTITRMGPA
jgi:hypothetical protein